MKSLLFAIVAVGISATCTLAQTTGTPEFDPLGEHLDLRKELRIIVEFIEVPHEQLTKLLEKPRRGANDGDLRKRVKRLVKKENARMLDTAVVTTTPGQRAKVESVLEKIYPTEYDPPDISQEAGADTEKKKGSKASKPSVIPPNPTAFDVRNVGTTLEVEPNIDADDITVSLNIAPEITYHVGDDSFGKWRTPEATLEVTQPRFYTLKCQTNFASIVGQYHMIAAVSPHDEKGHADYSRKVLIFVRTDIVAVGK